MGDKDSRPGYVEVTAKFRPSLLGVKFPFYCAALGTFGFFLMVTAIVVGSMTK